MVGLYIADRYRIEVNPSKKMLQKVQKKAAIGMLNYCEVNLILKLKSTRAG